MNKYIRSFGLQAVVQTTDRRSRNVSRFWQAFPFFVALAFGIVYVLVVNRTAAQGFQMKELERSIEDLRSENKKSEVRIAELQSLQSLENRLSEQDFVPVARVEYLTVNTPAVALGN